MSKISLLILSKAWRSKIHCGVILMGKGNGPFLRRIQYGKFGLEYNHPPLWNLDWLPTVSIKERYAHATSLSSFR
jgi:hypothetical protein